MANKEAKPRLFGAIKKEAPKAGVGLLAGLGLIAVGLPEAAALAAGGVVYLLLRRKKHQTANA